MGISGLLPALRSINEYCNIDAFAGRRGGVDVYCWLHKVCLHCAEELAEGTPTDRYIALTMHRVRQLTRAGVIPVLVFDGADLPLKQGTNAGRRAGRAAALQRAEELARSGRRAEARPFFQKALEVTHAIASTVIDAARAEGIECIVAPYEADAQLAYLAHRGYIDFVITEDSDLVAYMTPEVLYKLDPKGDGVLLRTSRLGEVREVSFANFTPDMILTNCIMAGCDYQSSLPGLGLKKSNALVKMYREIGRVLEAIQIEPKYKLAAPHVHGYQRGFIKSFFAFKHHRVWDPSERAVVSFRPVPLGDNGEAVDQRWLDTFLGAVWPADVAASVCSSCTHDPTTLQPYQRDCDANLQMYLGRRQGPSPVPHPALPQAPPPRPSAAAGLLIPVGRAAPKQPAPAPWVRATGGHRAFRPPRRLRGGSGGPAEPEVPQPASKSTAAASAEAAPPDPEPDAGDPAQQGRRPSSPGSSARQEPPRVLLGAPAPASSARLAVLAAAACPHGAPGCDSVHSVFVSCPPPRQPAPPPAAAAASTFLLPTRRPSPCPSPASAGSSDRTASLSLRSPAQPEPEGGASDGRTASLSPPSQRPGSDAATVRQTGDAPPGTPPGGAGSECETLLCGDSPPRAASPEAELDSDRRTGSPAAELDMFVDQPLGPVRSSPSVDVLQSFFVDQPLQPRRSTPMREVVCLDDPLDVDAEVERPRRARRAQRPPECLHGPARLRDAVRPMPRLGGPTADGLVELVCLDEPMPRPAGPAGSGSGRRSAASASQAPAAAASGRPSAARRRLGPPDPDALAALAALKPAGGAPAAGPRAPRAILRELSPNAAARLSGSKRSREPTEAAAAGWRVRQHRPVRARHV